MGDEIHQCLILKLNMEDFCFVVWIVLAIIRHSYRECGYTVNGCRAGTYSDLNIPAGYYTSVHGLGAAPTDTVFVGHLLRTIVFHFWDRHLLAIRELSLQELLSLGVGSGISSIAQRRSRQRASVVWISIRVCCAACRKAGLMWTLEGWFRPDVSSSLTRSSSAGAFQTPFWSGVFAGTISPPPARCGQTAYVDINCNFAFDIPNPNPN